MPGRRAARMTRSEVKLTLMPIAVANAGLCVIVYALEGPARLLVAGIAFLPIALAAVQLGFMLLRRRSPAAVSARPLPPLMPPRNLRIVGTAGSP